MTVRVAKMLLVLGVALLYFFTVFSNATDFGSNYQFVRHVLMMDSTLPGNHEMWHAINSPMMHTVFYVTIILWEAATMMLCVWGALRMLRALHGNAKAFQAASHMAIAGLTLSLLMWLVAFLAIGGEWFLMWQSKSWNGQEAAFRMFTVVGIVLLFVVQREHDD